MTEQSHNTIIEFRSHDNHIALSVHLDPQDETVWLSLNQISELFQRDKSVIAKHIKNIFKNEELDRNSVVAFFATTAADGKTYNVEHFNLDGAIGSSKPTIGQRSDH